VVEVEHDAQVPVRVVQEERGREVHRFPTGDSRCVPLRAYQQVVVIEPVMADRGEVGGADARGGERGLPAGQRLQEGRARNRLCAACVGGQERVGEAVGQCVEIEVLACSDRSSRRPARRPG
jgi:hypothetical protein